MSRNRGAVCIIVFSLLALAGRAFAHPEGFSGVRVNVSGHRVRVVATIHTRDTSAWFPPAKFPDYVKQVSAAMEAAPNDVIEVSFDDSPAAKPFAVKAFQVEVGLIEFDLEIGIPAGAKAMQIWSRHLRYLPKGHQQLLFIESDGETLLEDTLTTDHDSAVVDLPSRSGSATPQAASQPARPPTRISFFMLGVGHIVTGYDHLLFLAALLLVCRTFREAAAVITFFTVAHSITLTLAALDIVRMPGRIVEPAIAASIVYVGLENIFGKHRFGWRAGITFAFGLVHGLGFASALREVGLGSTSLGIAMPLLKFSIGLETGQLCIAAVILQVMLLLRKRPAFVEWWVPAGSVLVSLVGMFWLVTRVASG